MKIIRTKLNYSHEVMMTDLARLKKAFPNVEVGSIGISVMGRDIPYLRLGIGKKKVIYAASFHANEWITTPLLMKFAENALYAEQDGEVLQNHCIKALFDECSIYLVPMINPDGVNLVTGVLRQGDMEYSIARNIADNYPEIPFPSGWKSNIMGVDLNLQFEADWEQARENKAKINITGPAPRDYVGPAPLSAPEAIAIHKFTENINPRLILAYHTQGSVIYWQYKDLLPQGGSREIGQVLAQVSGYPLDDTPFASGFAGYKDWFIEKYNRPGYTIEAGMGESPLPLQDFDKIYAENEGVLIKAAILA